MARRLLYAPLLFAGLAGLIGLGSTLAEIRQQSYWRLGFYENLKIAVWEHSAHWIILGLLCGIAYALLALAAASISRTLQDRNRPIHPGLLYALALAAGMIVLASSGSEWNELRRWALVSMVMAWCVSLFASQALQQRPRARLVARTFRLATLAIPSVLVGLALQSSLSLSLLPATTSLRQPELLAGCVLAVLVAIWAVAGSKRNENGFDPLSQMRLLPATFCWLLIVAAALGTQVLSNPVKSGNPRNVLLIAVDTLRVDRTSLAGTPDAAARTPSLGSWAADGTVFTTAIAQAPWTMPSFASVFTGRYPRQHGAMSLSGHLRKSETTLAEVLRECGYWTAAVISHVFVNSGHGFAQGFDLYDEDNILGHREITSELVTDRAIEILNQRGDQPFFLFLHYFDPHSDYRDHVSEQHADDYEGWLRKLTDIGDLRNDRHLLTEEDIDFLQDLYDEEIAFTDAQIGRLFDRMKELGLDEDTAVVFVSDHGEEFLERGWLGHTIHLHDELVRVPLFFTLPGLSDRAPIVREPVETRAIFATLLDYLEIDLESLDRSASLLDAIQSKQKHPGVAYSEVWLPDAPVASGKRFQISMLRTKKWKLMRDHGRDLVRLFDLESDPGETREIASDEAKEFKELDARLSHWMETMQDAPAAPTRELTPELAEQLRALGYIGQ